MNFKDTVLNTKNLTKIGVGTLHYDMENVGLQYESRRLGSEVVFSVYFLGFKKSRRKIFAATSIGFSAEILKLRQTQNRKRSEI